MQKQHPRQTTDLARARTYPKRCAEGRKGRVSREKGELNLALTSGKAGERGRDGVQSRYREEREATAETEARARQPPHRHGSVIAKTPALSETKRALSVLTTLKPSYTPSAPEAQTQKSRETRSRQCDTSAPQSTLTRKSAQHERREGVTRAQRQRKPDFNLQNQAPGNRD